MTYCTLGDVKQALRISVDDTRDDDRIEAAIGAAADVIDNWCGRGFVAAGTAATTRVFEPDSPRLVFVDDIADDDDVVVEIDSTCDGTYARTLAAGDVQFLPVARRRGSQTLPYTAIRFLSPMPMCLGQHRYAPVRVTAKFGWPATPDVVVKACVLQSIKFYKRDEAPFGVAGFGELGVLRITRNLDPDVEAALAPYRRHELGLA